MAKLQAVVAEMEADLRQRQTSLAALNQVLTFGYPAVRPDAVGEVNAWAGRYGKRGNLQAYLLEQLQSIFPGSLTSLELTDRVCSQFNIVCGTSWQKSRQKDRVKRALNLLKDAGSVVALHDIQSNRVGRWAWAGDEPLSFAEALALQKASYEHYNGPNNTPAHAT